MISAFSQAHLNVPKISCDSDSFVPWDTDFPKDKYTILYPGGQVIAVDIENLDTGTGSQYIGQNHPEHRDMDFDIKDIWVMVQHPTDSGWLKAEYGTESLEEFIKEAVWEKVATKLAEAKNEYISCRLDAGREAAIEEALTHG